MFSAFKNMWVLSTQPYKVTFLMIIGTALLLRIVDLISDPDFLMYETGRREVVLADRIGLLIHIALFLTLLIVSSSVYVTPLCWLQDNTSHGELFFLIIGLAIQYVLLHYLPWWILNFWNRMRWKSSVSG